MSVPVGVAPTLESVLRRASLASNTVRVSRLEDIVENCGYRPCLVVLEDANMVAELIVAGGRVTAARLVEGGRRVYGDDALRRVSRLLPVEARVYVLRDRLVEWRDEELTVWIRGIDLQHRQLVKALNNLYSSLLNGNASYVYEALAFMREYAGFHFTTEERLMERYGYPRLEEHRRQHTWFIAETERLANLLRGEGLEAAIETMLFLARWTEEHIKRIDRDYGLWIRRVAGRGN